MRISANDRSAAPASGARLLASWMQSACFFNVDEACQLARALEQCCVPASRTSVGNVLSVTRKELRPFRVIADVGRDYVEWEIEADLIDGQPETQTVDNNGEPFRLTRARGNDDFGRYYEWVYEEPQRWYESHEPGSPF